MRCTEAVTVELKEGMPDPKAGVLSETGNVLATMPHPGRENEPGAVDGVKIFNSVIVHIEEYGRRKFTA